MSKWPVKVKHRNKVFAKIYRPCEGRDSYRVAWTAAGQRQMKSFQTYSGEKGARKFAEGLVTDLAKQNSVALLTATQASDALAALGLLNAFREATGRHVSLTSAVSVFCESSKKLGARDMSEAVAGFLQNSASVQPKEIGQAVTDFLTGSEHLTQSKDGKRAQLSAKYAYIREIQLRRFANTFPGQVVCDLTKAHLDQFITGHGNIITGCGVQRAATLNEQQD